MYTYVYIYIYIYMYVYIDIYIYTKLHILYIKLYKIVQLYEA